MADKFKSCSIDNCNGNAARSAKGRRGYCWSHYTRLLKYGDPLQVGRWTKPGEPRRFIEYAIESTADTCITWPYGKNTQGYGIVMIDGRNNFAHRYVCQVAHGTPPTPIHHAAHGCGNKVCINPKHLRWASNTENQADKLRHGTHSRGEKHGSAKLTEAAVREILSLKGKESQNSIAKRFGVGKSTIYNIHSRKRWGWL
jgi:hypothetical protein